MSKVLAASTARKTKKTRKVIWAIDPFMKEKRLQLSVAKGLQGLLGAESAEIEPVYVLNTSRYSARLPLLDEIVALAEESAAQESTSILKKIRLPRHTAVKVLADSYSGRQGEVSALLAYAHEQKADLIALSTHGRKGLQRWLMGSFAEALLLSSTIPLLVVNPHWKAPADFKRVLFPTDFSPESKKAYVRILENVKANQGSVTIFHHIPYLCGPEVKAMAEAYPVFHQEFEKIVSDKKCDADAWLSLARAKGVNAQAIIDTKSEGSSSDAILQYVKRKPSLIAMAARSGKVASAILGSTTRQVLRGAIVPVWVVREEGKSKKIKQPLFQITQEDIDMNLIDHVSRPTITSS